MANTGKQSPLGINVVGSFLLNQGLSINPVASSYMGSSKTNDDYSFGKLVSGTSLRMLTWAINDAFLRGKVSSEVYDNLISIGKDIIPALGNAKPSTYVAQDPANIWTTTAVKYGNQKGVSTSRPGPATSGYAITGDIGQGQQASWLPYTTDNNNSSVTQWGYVRLHALQAWNEFNWNNDEADVFTPNYTNFLSSFLSIKSFIEYNNQAILANQNAKTFLDGSYSNMDDLISADIFGVNLSNSLFGSDIENLGRAIDFSRIDSFGLPSVLLRILGENNAVNQDLALVLLSSGLESSEVQDLISGNIENPTIQQEQKIYSAYLIISGGNLNEILSALQCNTVGLTRLSDLLDVKKIFPNSYQALTVPKYNSELGLPTNSKTYYPLYISNGINPALTTDDMNNYAGIQTPKRMPNVVRNRTLDARNITVPKKGFGSYLFDILPRDKAVAAGAFSFAMRQIKNLDRVNTKKFARAVKSLENTRNLDLVNGTSKPTNQEAILNVQTKEALGTGPYGSYTMSDFLGCMTGLPYAWKKIYSLIKDTETEQLFEIYKQLFLAVSSEPAEATVQSVEDPAGTWTVTGITITNKGGGYGRENAAAPTVTINGVVVDAVIGTDDSQTGSNNAGDFGRITSISLPTETFSSLPEITIGSPPGPGFPAMDDVIQDYIDQANSEIEKILEEKADLVKLLNIYWDTLGSQLAIEQRARYTALPPVAVPIDLFLNPYPTSVNVFIDSIPDIAQDTIPHMTAQSLEAICNLRTLGGQSTVALMRQERNEVRLASTGIPLDNNIPDDISEMDKKTLITNNTIPAGINNAIPSPSIDLINSSPEIYGDVTNGAIGFTNPALNTNELDDNTLITSVPNGSYIPSDSKLLGEFLPALTTKDGDISNIINGDPVPIVNTVIPATTLTSPTENITTISSPEQLETNVPVNLNSDYAGSVLLPTTYNIDEAIERVIECNCDCWLD